MPRLYELLFGVVGLMGLMMIFGGVGYSVYDKNLLIKFRAIRKDNPAFSKGISIVDKLTSLPVFVNIKKEVEPLFILNLNNENQMKLKTSCICIGIVLMTLTNMWLLLPAGKLWYTKILGILISIFMPYYLVTLLGDMYRERINRQIPRLIDEFRSAFIKHNKVKPALRESGRQVSGAIGKSVESIAHCTDMKDELIMLKDRLGNVWLNVFVQLIINYKSNGGELVDQLYRLNKTMVIYNNLDKKKTKRLIWYEIFAVIISIASIPAIYWLNDTVLGTYGYVAADTQSNMIIFRIFCYTLLSLLVMRLLRRM